MSGRVRRSRRRSPLASRRPEVRTQLAHESSQAFAARGRRQRRVDDDHAARAVRQFEDAAVVRDLARLAGLVRETVAFVEAAGKLVVPLLGEQRLEQPRVFAGSRKRDPLEQRGGIVRRMGVAPGRARVGDQRQRARKPATNRGVAEAPGSAAFGDPVASQEVDQDVGRHIVGAGQHEASELLEARPAACLKRCGQVVRGQVLREDFDLRAGLSRTAPPALAERGGDRHFDHAGGCEFDAPSRPEAELPSVGQRLDLDSGVAQLRRGCQS